MNAHLTDQQLNAYIHQTPNDAQRETLDAHLTGCPACRARFNEWDVLQQRVQRELAAELKAVNVPLSLSFAGTTMRRPRAVNAAWFWQQSGRVLIGLIALAIVALVAAGLLGAMHQTTTEPRPTPSPAHVVSTSGYVGGWNLYSDSNANEYEVGLDSEVKHSGKASGYLSSTLSNPKGFGTLMQMMPPFRYQGKRVRLSGYIKTEQVADLAGLWMRIDDAQGTPSNLDNIHTRPIRGTTDWQKYAVVLDVPANSTNFALGVLLNGGGRVWIDDVQLEVVGADVPTTALTAEVIAAATTPSPANQAALDQSTNLSFEAGTTGWSLVGDTQSYTGSVDSTVAFDGQSSGVLTWDVSQPIGSAKLVQSIKANPYRNQRVRISARVKSDSVSEWKARLFADVYNAQDWPLLDDSRPMRGADWQNFEMVFDVPEDATRIEYGISLEGQGRAWLDNVQVEVVGKDVSVTTYAESSGTRPRLPKGVDLDGEMSNWYVAGSAPQSYEMGFDSTIAYSGRSSAYIKSILPVRAPDSGAFSTGSTVDYRGRRIRLSAYIKAQDVEGWAGLWMEVGRPWHEVLGYDDMSVRPIRGTSDWQKYEVVLDVPDNSEGYGYGVTLNGQGEVWFDDVKLEVVGDDVPVTGMLNRSQPVNADFENVK